MTKEEKIKEEYKKQKGLEWYENNFEFINFDNGYFQNREEYFRIDSLQGIEDNNGWTKIESIDDLPKEKGFYLFLSGIGHTTYGVEDVNYAPEWFVKKYTHWKPKQEHKKPLY